jgi:hypothetical protein
MWDIENENKADQTIDSKKIILSLIPFVLKNAVLFNRARPGHARSCLISATARQPAKDKNTSRQRRL